MPIYEYRCDACGASFEVLQRMSDDPLETCEECGGALRKVMHPVAIHFKGSGFYTTDYGKGSGRRASAKDAAADSASGADASSTGEGSGADGKPAPGEAKAKEKQKAT